MLAGSVSDPLVPTPCPSPSHLLLGMGRSTPRTCRSQAPLVAQTVKNLPAMKETQVQSLGWEDPLEKGTATCLEKGEFTGSGDCSRGQLVRDVLSSREKEARGTCCAFPKLSFHLNS